MSGGREWANYAPEGCVHTMSTTESTPEQRERFKKIAQVRPQHSTRPPWNRR